ncbi:hypothetical protein Rcae01_00585 [Novipirellula caenicola]|uniref:Uncharacterized protein n=1 Tax=Novipirellula caenicola TaxID=1536901 RepID=A0ABP9VIV5_9BACT
MGTNKAQRAADLRTFYRPPASRRPLTPKPLAHANGIHGAGLRPKFSWDFRPRIKRRVKLERLISLVDSAHLPAKNPFGLNGFPFLETRSMWARLLYGAGLALAASQLFAQAPI